MHLMDEVPEAASIDPFRQRPRPTIEDFKRSVEELGFEVKQDGFATVKWLDVTMPRNDPRSFEVVTAAFAAYESLDFHMKFRTDGEMVVCRFEQIA